MKLGVVFPHNEIGTDPVAIRDFAQGAEALGADHMLIYDHVLGADPDHPGGWNGTDVDAHLKCQEQYFRGGPRVI